MTDLSTTTALMIIIGVSVACALLWASLGRASKKYARMSPPTLTQRVDAPDPQPVPVVDFFRNTASTTLVLSEVPVAPLPKLIGTQESFKAVSEPKPPQVKAPATAKKPASTKKPSGKVSRPKTGKRQGGKPRAVN